MFCDFCLDELAFMFCKKPVEGDGWLSCKRTCMLRQLSGFESTPDISQKYKTGDITKGVANTL
jgi:hypothetical protein